jgi:hypothetical protein
VKGDCGQKHSEQDVPRKREPETAHGQQQHGDNENGARASVNARAFARREGGKTNNDGNTPNGEMGCS